MNKKKGKIRSLIFRIIIITIAGLTAGYSFFMWNAAGLLDNQLPMPFGVGAAVVLSGSMEPTLMTNDLVIVTERDSYEVGEIIVYQSGRSLVIHRIISINGSEVVTQGDANNTPDHEFSVSQIKGAYAFRIPLLGLVFKFIKSLPGTIIIVAAALYLMFRSRQKEREENEKELALLADEIRNLRAERDSLNAPALTADISSDDAAVETISDDSVAVAAVSETDPQQIDVSESDIEAPSEPLEDTESVEVAEALPSSSDEIIDDSVIDEILEFNQDVNPSVEPPSEEELIDEILAFNNEQNPDSVIDE